MIIENTFHNTSIRVNFPTKGGMPLRFSHRVSLRIRRELCGMKDCTCFPNHFVVIVDGNSHDWFVSDDQHGNILLDHLGVE